jgi:hypothetical protein
VDVYEKHEADPQLRLKKNVFTFSMRPEVFSLILKRLVEIELLRGTANLNKFLQVCEKCKPEAKMEILADLEKKLSESAFPVKFIKREIKQNEKEEQKDGNRG